MRYNRIPISRFLLFLLVVVFFGAGSVTAHADEPIAKDGTIDNTYWGIVMQDEAAAQTNTEQITAALKWAAENGHTKVKLMKGIYYTNGENRHVQMTSDNSIMVPSNIEWDLNGSTLIQKTTSMPAYTMITLAGCENIKIYNGTLRGDRKTHTFTREGYTHEFGYGIDLRASNQVELYDLEIYEMTGDSIIVGGNDKMLASGMGKLSNNVKIYNCELHDNRRQGISVIAADDVEIYDNVIYNIKGTLPESGIDLEASNDWTVTNVKIYRNNIYNTNNSGIIVSENTKDIDIYENNIDGNIAMVKGVNTHIRNNYITNGGIYSTDTPDPYNTIVDSNELENSEIRVYNNERMVVSNNKLVNSQIVYSYTNGAIFGNELYTEEENVSEFGIQLYGDRLAGRRTFDVILVDNSFEGNFNREELISQSYVKVTKDEAGLEEFLNEGITIDDNATPQSPGVPMIPNINYVIWLVAVMLILLGIAVSVVLAERKRQAF